MVDNTLTQGRAMQTHPAAALAEDRHLATGHIQDLPQHVPERSGAVAYRAPGPQFTERRCRSDLVEESIPLPF